jgi:hypothetical protein
MSAKWKSTGFSTGPVCRKCACSLAAKLVKELAAIAARPKDESK